MRPSHLDPVGNGWWLKSIEGQQLKFIKGVPFVSFPFVCCSLLLFVLEEGAEHITSSLRYSLPDPERCSSGKFMDKVLKIFFLYVHRVRSANTQHFR